MEQTSITLEEIFPQWEKLTPRQQQLVSAQTRQMHFSRGQLLHRGHNDCLGLLLVRDGQLRVFIESTGGKEVTLYRMFSWDICLFTASCILKNISFEVNVQAERDSDVFVVPAPLYDSLMKESLPVADYTNQLMASHFSDVMWMVEQILFTSFDSRLSAFLLEQSEIESSPSLTITHEEIARNLGSAREVVSRMLKYFADDGLVQLSRGRVTLLDSKRLRALVQ